VTVVGRQATRSDFQLGIGLGFAGALVLLVSVFLPLADSKQFVHVAENSLIQHGEGWLVVGLALAAAGISYRILVGEGSPIWLMVAGGAALGLSVVFGTSDSLLTLTSTAPEELGVLEELESIAEPERASPGIGIYAVGLGGLLVLIGGYLLRSPDADEQAMSEERE
jgi:hypothetical protein